jgi:hypothetical protein
MSWISEIRLFLKVCFTFATLLTLKLDLFKNEIITIQNTGL